MAKKQRKNFKRVTRGQLEAQKWLIHGLDQMVEELLLRVAELEARPVYPVYPVYPAYPVCPPTWPPPVDHPSNPWGNPWDITVTCNTRRYVGTDG